MSRGTDGEASTLSLEKQRSETRDKERQGMKEKDVTFLAPAAHVCRFQTQSTRRGRTRQQSSSGLQQQQQSTSCRELQPEMMMMMRKMSRCCLWTRRRVSSHRSPCARAAAAPKLAVVVLAGCEKRA